MIELRGGLAPLELFQQCERGDFLGRLGGNLDFVRLIAGALDFYPDSQLDKENHVAT